MSPDKLNCFKAYDIRGRVPDQLDGELAYRIGQAFADYTGARRVAVGRDARLSSPQLAEAVSRGVLDRGVDILELGLCATEEVYFASMTADIDGGIMVTASHNPASYNGMKFILADGVPFAGSYNLDGLRQRLKNPVTDRRDMTAARQKTATRSNYIKWLLERVEPAGLTPLSIVANCGNGSAGPIIAALEKELPFTFIKLLSEPDGSFPNGVPNPLLAENRSLTSRAVLENDADLGIAWDGDCDRCFLFNERGDFIESYYLVGLLASLLLEGHPGNVIVHDTRLVWNTVEAVTKAGGRTVMSRAGHTFFKQRMRTENAIYGGEMSGHHFFRDFSFCDSGMLPWLLVCREMCRTGASLSRLTDRAIMDYPVSGEINISVADAGVAFSRAEEWCAGFEGARDDTDGLSFSTDRFRINLRRSHTEPILRLNIETRGDQRLLHETTRQLLKVITLCE